MPGADVLAGLLDEPVGVQGQHAAPRQVGISGRVAARAGAEHHPARHVEELGGVARVAQRGRQMPGAGELAVPGCRVVRRVQAGGAEKLTVWH
jgi:hypothetical protein